MPLIDFWDTDTRTIAVEGIRASVMQNDQGKYEVLLEINSNKMLIAMQGALDYIEQFEIIADNGNKEEEIQLLASLKDLIEVKKFK